jgi:hypothetical protein
VLPEHGNARPLRQPISPWRYRQDNGWALPNWLGAPSDRIADYGKRPGRDDVCHRISPLVIAARHGKRGRERVPAPPLQHVNNVNIG